MTTPENRLKNARIAAGFNSARETALHFNWPESTYRSHESEGSNRPLTWRAAGQYAPKLGVTKEWLMLGIKQENSDKFKKSSRTFDVDNPTTTDRNADNVKNVQNVDFVQVIGEVAAGVWHEIDQMKVFDTYEIPFEPDPRFPRDAYRAFEIKGPSINRQASDGSRAIGILAWAVHRGPQPDDWVVVKRTDKSGKEETTIKKVTAGKNGRLELCPDSDDENFQECIILADNKTEKVEIFAYITDFSKKATNIKGLI